MATSGYRDVVVTNWDTLRFNWWQTGQSIPNNETYISWNLQLISGKYGSINSSTSKAWSVNVNGSYYSGSVSVDIANNTTKTLASGSTTISHNSDGTKSFAYSFSQDFKITFSGSYIGTVSGSGSESLDSILRYATMTGAPDFNDEDTNLTIYFDNPGNFDLQLKIEAGGDGGLIVRDKVTKTSPYTFVLSEDEKKRLRQKCTSTSMPVRFTVATYLNGVVTNWQWIDKTMTLINYMPTLNPTVVDVGSVSTKLTGNPNKIILNFNVVQVVFNASAKKEAYITSMKATCGNNSLYSDGYMDYVNSGTFVFTVTDSRGHTITNTVTKDVVNYIPLTCNAWYEAELVDGSTANIRLDIWGDYFNGSFGASSNTLTLEYRYKVNNGSYPDVWTAITNPTLSDGKYSANKTFTGINYTDTYTFQVRAADAIHNGEGSKYYEFVAKVLPVFDWSEKDFNFNVPVKYMGKPLSLQCYPVNSIYISYSHDSPASLFGGTWTRIENRFLWGCTSNGNIGDTGGEYSHTLTVDEMPSHSHYVFATDINATGHGANHDVYPYKAWTSNYNEIYSWPVGGNQPHNNIPPYIQVSIWRRTA